MADTYDVLTAQEAADALPGAGTADTTKLAMLNTAVSNVLDANCGPIVTRSVTRTFFAPSGRLWLDIPVGSPTFTISAVTVKEYTNGVETTLAAETATVSTGSDYRYDSVLGSISRRSSWSDTRWGTQEVLVTYTAGRYASTATVGAKFKQAAKIILAREWALEQGFAGFSDDVVPLPSGFLVPKRVNEYLRGELIDRAVIA